MKRRRAEKESRKPDRRGEGGRVGGEDGEQGLQPAEALAFQHSACLSLTLSCNTAQRYPNTYAVAQQELINCLMSVLFSGSQQGLYKKLRLTISHICFHVCDLSSRFI